jgi:hypothetical protein
MGLMPLDECSNLAMAIYLLVEAMFILSVFVSLPHYSQRLATISEEEPVKPRLETEIRPVIKTAIILLHSVGFLGLTLYVIEFSRNLGGIAGFFLALVSEAYVIRLETLTSSSIGTQLSYFGWIAISLTVFFFAQRKLSGRWLLIAFVQFLGNILYIDRTRPFWIIITSLLMLLPAVRVLNVKKITRWLVASTFAALMIFWAIAEWSGKTGYNEIYESSLLPGITQDIYVYGVSGFAYFNKILESNEQLSYSPKRILYPAYKYLAKFGVTDDPPIQVLDFYEVPFSTNVGTFLEPFYRDGGLLFVLCGIIIYSFGLDLLGLYLFSSGKPLAIFAWSNLCFTTFIGFFTPKITSFPIWLFVVFGVISLFAQNEILRSGGKSP